MAGYIPRIDLYSDSYATPPGSWVPEGPHHVAVAFFPGTSSFKTTDVEAFIASSDPADLPPCSIYYPTSTSPPESRSLWPTADPGGDSAYVRGLGRYVRLPTFVVALLGGSRIRAVDASSPTPAPLDPSIAAAFTVAPAGGGPSPPAVVVFAHGLAGHSQNYSHLASELAARGCVVVCPLFLDGSASFATTPLPPPAHVVLHARHPEELPRGMTPMQHREAQLELRRRQVCRTLDVLAAGALLPHAVPALGADVCARIAAAVRGSSGVVLAGHSFGSATQVAVVATPPAPRVVVRRVVCYDCWWEPLGPTLATAAAAAAAPLPPLLLRDSEHWENLPEARGGAGRLLRLWAARGSPADRRVREGTDHYSVSDVGVLMPWVGRRPERARGVMSDHAAIREWAGDCVVGGAAG